MTRTEIEFLILKHCSVETYDNKGKIEAYAMDLNGVIEDLVKAYKKEYGTSPQKPLSIKAKDLDNVINNILVKSESIFKIEN